MYVRKVGGKQVTSILKLECGTLLALLYEKRVLHRDLLGMLHFEPFFSRSIINYNFENISGEIETMSTRTRGSTMPISTVKA